MSSANGDVSPSLIGHAAPPLFSAESSEVLGLAGDHGKSADHADFWAEFQRRRREDRAQRQSQGSEVQKLLATVKQERCNSLDASLCSTPSDATPARLGAECQGTSAKKVSEVQRILLEVKHEREVGSTEPANGITPKPAAFESRLQQPAPRVSKLQLVRAGAGPETVNTEADMPVRDKKPSSHVDADRKDSLASCEMEKGGSSTDIPDASSVQHGSAEGDKAPAAQDGTSTVEKSSEMQLTVPACDNTSARIPKSSLSRTPLSSSRSQRYSSPIRRSSTPPPHTSQELVISSPSRTPSRSSRLRASSVPSRRPHTRDTRNAKPEFPSFMDASGKYMGYPNGGWDDRTSCPRSFDGFLGRLHPGKLDSPYPRVPSPRSRSSFRASPWNDRTLCPGSFDGFLDHLGRNTRKVRAS